MEDLSAHELARHDPLLDCELLVHPSQRNSHPIPISLQSSLHRSQHPVQMCGRQIFTSVSNPVISLLFATIADVTKSKGNQLHIKLLSTSFRFHSAIFLGIRDCANVLALLRNLKFDEPWRHAHVRGGFSDSVATPFVVRFCSSIHSSSEYSLLIAQYMYGSVFTFRGLERYCAGSVFTWTNGQREFGRDWSITPMQRLPT
jgi:hypothetical protein